MFDTHKAISICPYTAWIETTLYNNILTVVVVIVWLLDLQPLMQVSASHKKSWIFESRSWRGILDATLCDKACQ